MPDPEDRDRPVGQTYGAATQQARFMQATQPTGTPSRPGAVAAPPTALDLPMQAEPDMPNVVDLDDGPLSLDDLLFKGTERPDEPVTAGILEPMRMRVSERLQALADAGLASDDVLELLNTARRLDL